MKQVDMRELELTDEAIAKLATPSHKNEMVFRDTKQPGLAIRIRATGGISWIYRFTSPGGAGQKRKSIGGWPRFKEKAARNAATLIAADLLRGKDPTEAKREAKRGSREKSNTRERMTLGALVSGDGCPYEAALKSRKVVNWKVVVSALRRGLADHMTANIKTLERLDFTDAVDAIAATGKTGAADDLRKHSHTFLEWAVSKGYVKHNVLAGYRKPKQTRAQKIGRKSKGRALTDEEIIKVWNAGGKSGAFGLVVRACLLGGSRRSEPTSMHWKKHVMPDRITFDESWTKMGLHHDVPRTELISDLLDDAKRFERATSDFVFPSSKTGCQISGFTQLLAEFISEAGVEKFTMHDLRRTLRTIMSRCGYDDQIQRLCVGQKPKGIDAVYNKDEQWIIRKMAFEAAHDYITEVIGGKRADNVVRLRTNPLDKIKAEMLGRLREYYATSAI